MNTDQTTPTPTPNFLPPVGEWLCRKAFNASNLTYFDSETEIVEWDELPADAKRRFWLYSQCLLIAMHGAEIAEMLIGCKAEILAMAKAKAGQDQREGGEG